MKKQIEKLYGGELKQNESPSPSNYIPIEIDKPCIKVNGIKYPMLLTDKKIKRIYKERNKWYVEYEKPEIKEIKKWLLEQDATIYFIKEIGNEEK